ncbi:MAG: M20/M25/M40 family metallo-hydrolase, partial [Alphaproteobacteria bacterium]
SFEPGAGNVVPQRAELLVEYRDIDLAVMDRMEAAIKAGVAAANRVGGVTTDSFMLEAARPAHMDRSVGGAIEAAAAESDVSALFMPSGAGHDAMHLADKIASGMLFIPSKGGRSHDTAEDSAEADIVLGCEVLGGAVIRLLGDSR